MSWLKALELKKQTQTFAFLSLCHLLGICDICEYIY